MKWSGGLVFLILMSCQPVNQAQSHVNHAVKELTGLLEGVQTKEDLVARAKEFKKGYEKLAAGLVELKLALDQHPKGHRHRNLAMEQAYKAALERVYAMEGGKELLQKFAQEGLYLLDIKEKELAAKKEHHLKVKRPHFLQTDD
jgi:hypothetical protein